MAAPAALRAATILVVDDSADHREILADCLRLSGHEVRTAGSGAEAVATLDAGFAPAVLVLDLLMPGEDGATLLRRIRARPGSSFRVVVVTGVVSNDLRRLLDVDAVLFKPVDMPELLAAIARLAP